MYDNKKLENLPVILNRPNRPTQVFGYPGDNTVLIDYCPGRGEDIKMVTIRQIDKEWMSVRYLEGLLAKDDRLYSINMADRGMIPYVNGLWNKNNWVELAK